MKTYKGKYKLRKPEKYVGDPDSVVYRSWWERQTFKWVEDNNEIIEWNSEEVIIPYVCETDNKLHRYFIDLYFKTSDGKRFLIEIKPKAQVSPPKKPKRQTKKFISESLTYIKNQSKWKAAQEFALDNGCLFQIWTEDTLTGLGIKISTEAKKKPKPFKPLKKPIRRKK